MRAIIMKPADNVCTVVETVESGTAVTVGDITVNVTEKIPFGHKFAITAIAKGEEVKKYGETIGLATRDIQPGQHVHVHNMESRRGRGDK